MPGSWEIRKSNSVLIGILHVDVTTVAWSFGVRNLIVPGREELRMFPPFQPVAGMPFDHGRNSICKAVLDLGAEWLFFLDSDVIPPKDALVRLIAHQKPIISGVYHRRSPPEGIAVMLKGTVGPDGKPAVQWMTQYPPNQVIEVDLVGAGCLLIHRSVLERLPPQRKEQGKHWFDWRVDCKGILPEHECLSEDFTFNTWAKRHGYKILVDTSIQCRHAGFGEATYNSFKPLETRSFT